RREQRPGRDRQGVGGEGKGRAYRRFRHQPGRQADADGRRRGAGEVRARHHRPAELVRAGQGRAVGTRRRHDEGADRQIRRAQRGGEVSRHPERSLDRGAVDPNTLTLPSVARIDIFKEAVGLDVTKMYPAGGPPDKELADKWTWDFWLQAAEKCKKAGHPFGMPMGQTGDSMNWVGAIFTAYGAELVDKDGNVTVKSDPVKQMLEFFKKLVPNLPNGVFAWNDSSNNKALISGEA